MALRSDAAAERSEDQLSREFLGLFDVRLLQYLPIGDAACSARESSVDGTGRPTALAHFEIDRRSNLVAAQPA